MRSLPAFRATRAVLLATAAFAVGSFVSHPAMADFDITTPVTSGQSLIDGETGTIEATGSIIVASPSAAIIAGLSVPAAIINHGIVSGSTGINIDTSDFSGSIDNSGTITGMAGDGIGLSFSSVGGGIINRATGTIQGATNAIEFFDLSASTAVTIYGGHIIGDIIDTTGSFLSSVEIAGDFTTQGNITSIQSLMVDSGMTLTISGGNAVQVNDMSAAGGTLAFGVASVATHGFLGIDANILDLTGITVKVVVDPGNTLSAGDVIHIGSGTGAGVIGASSTTPTLVGDNSNAFNFEMVRGDYGTIGDSAQNLYLLVLTQALAFTPSTANGVNANAVLSTLSGTTDPVLSQVVSNISGATSQAQIDSLVSSTQPEMNGASLQASEAVSDQSFDLISRWLSGGSAASGMSSGDNALNSLQGWGQAFGTHSSQSSRDGVAGYTANTGGFAMGVDTGDHYSWGKAGVAVSYARTFARSDSANRTGTGIDSYGVTAYGQYALHDGFYVRGMAAYVRGSNDLTRHDVGGVAGVDAHGSFDSDQYTARAVLARDYPGSDGMVFTPHALADITHYDPQDYTETGAGGAGLAVDQKSLNTAAIGLGETVKWDWKHINGSTLTPELRADYRYSLLDDRLEDTSSFTAGGGAFSLEGPKPSRSDITLGAGLAYKDAAGWSLRADYDFDYKTDYTAHTGTVKFILPF